MIHMIKVKQENFQHYILVLQLTCNTIMITVQIGCAYRHNLLPITCVGSKVQCAEHVVMVIYMLSLLLPWWFIYFQIVSVLLPWLLNAFCAVAMVTYTVCFLCCYHGILTCFLCCYHGILTCFLCCYHGYLHVFCVVTMVTYMLSGCECRTCWLVVPDLPLWLHDVPVDTGKTMDSQLGYWRTTAECSSLETPHNHLAWNPGNPSSVSGTLPLCGLLAKLTQSLISHPCSVLSLSALPYYGSVSYR